MNLRIGDCSEKQVQGDESAFILSPRHLTNIVAYDQEATTYDEQHAGKPISHKQLDEFMNLVFPPANVLDLGTGFGHDAKYLSTKYTVTGVEISHKSAAIARFENPGMNIISSRYGEI
jgi:SAM-dependent methyltransferase